MKLRGFAAMDKEVARAIRVKGGQNSPTNFKRLTPEQRREFGRRGGAKSRKKS